MTLPSTRQALTRYRKMRDFNVTREPAGKLGPAPKSTAARRSFVIQEHHASHLHYDFRLEAEGVLKSWAIPKQPVADAAVKRLAIEVEDHPLDYADFTGAIPAGQYGAGTVAIWDRGYYECLAPGKFSELKNSGKLEIRLHGERLQGTFKLVRTSGAGARAKWLLRYVDLSARKTPTSEELFLKVEGHVLKLTRLGKVLFPQTGFTKKKCLNYYRKVAPYLLPQMSGFPVSLKRFPDGTGAESFFEKNASTQRPAWIGKTEIGRAEPYLIQNLASLLWAVNLAALEFHTYLSPVGRPEEAALLILDLDPGDGADLLDCAWLALEIRKHLSRAKLQSFVKTSGSKGLHVIVPLHSKTSFAESRAFAQALAETLAKLFPRRVTSLQKKELRQGRVLIDWQQNDPKKTTAAVFSMRAVEPPQVSFPLRWSEVTSAVRKRDASELRYSPARALESLAKHGNPFEKTLSLRQRLPRD